MSIMHYVITLDLNQIPLQADLQYEQYKQQIQNTVSNHNFLKLIYVEISHFSYGGFNICT